MRLGASVLSIVLLCAALPAPAADFGLEIKTWVDAFPSGDPSPHAWIRETYTLTAHPRPWLFFELVPIVERDSNGAILRDDLYDDTDRGLVRSASRFRAASVGFRAGRTTVVAGKQRLTWGRASFVSATDNLAPRDWTDPLDEVRLAPWAVDATWERERWHAEGAVVPRYAPSRLPAPNGRWFMPVPATVPNPAYPAVGPKALTVELAWGNAEFPPVSWDTLQEGVRAGYRGPRGEVQASFFRGYDDAPALIPRVGAPDLAAGRLPVFLDRRFLRLDVAGLDGEVLAGAWIVRGEAGYFHYPGAAADGYLLGEVEAEWTRESWQLIVGYADSIGGSPSAVAPTALDQALTPSAFVRMARVEVTGWEAALDAAIGTDHGDALLRLSGSYPFGGHLRVGGEVDAIRGDAGTFWGRWRDNDRLRVFARLSF